MQLGLAEREEELEVDGFEREVSSEVGGHGSGV
jgi:hypothetical protein